MKKRNVKPIITYQEKISLLCKKYNISASEATQVLQGNPYINNEFITEKRFLKELEKLEELGGE